MNLIKSDGHLYLCYLRLSSWCSLGVLPHKKYLKSKFPKVQHDSKSRYFIFYHWYRTFRSKTTCSPEWRAKTKGSRLKVSPLVPALRLGTKWRHLVPVGNTNHDYRGHQAVTWRHPWPPHLVPVGIPNRD